MNGEDVFEYKSDIISELFNQVNWKNNNVTILITEEASVTLLAPRVGCLVITLNYKLLHVLNASLTN